MNKPSILIICLALGVFLTSAQAQYYPPAPGHEKLPVLFWAHYMPQVATAQLDQNGHAQGGTDSFPFITIAPDSEEQQIKYALDAGLDGFQSLVSVPPSMYEACRKIFSETGKMFYINPDWAGLGTDPEKAAKHMGDFTLQQKNNSHLFRVNGKPLYFFYNHGTWAGSQNGQFSKVNENDSENVEQVKDIMHRMGAEALLLPSFFFFDKVLLDRKDLLFRPWPAFQSIHPGKEQWLAETKWDGQGCWNPCNVRPDVAAVMNEKLKTAANGFLFIPAVWPGYDSSNRAWQAIHCPSYGLKVFHDNLRMWVTMGYRQINFITWNDVNETMILPSTRSPFGFSEITRYYHQLAVDGTSPFDTPKAVVSYDPETLYGDELYFQFLILPEKDAPSSDYICHVRFEDEEGQEVLSLTTRSSVPDQRTDALSEARFDTTQFTRYIETLSPVVDVTRIDNISNERKAIYKNLRLAPIILRQNKIEFYTPYAIALDRVDKELSLSLSANSSSSNMVIVPTGGILPLEVKYKGNEPMRRITLAESRLTRGAFRAEDTAETIGEENITAFLRIRCDQEFTYTISLSSGEIIDRFANNYKYNHSLTKVNSSSFETKSFPHGRSKEHRDKMESSIGMPVFRLVATPNSTISLIPKGFDKPVLETALSQLASGPLTIQANIDGVDTTIRLELALDAIELNTDYPLPQQGKLIRFVNIDKYHNATRYFHVWSLTASDKIAYSKPLTVIRKPVDTRGTVIQNPDTPVECQLIQTHGVFDDFVDSMSGASRNPFLQSDILKTVAPARLIPYYLLDMNEAAGSQINDSGTAHQVGRGWLSGDYNWIKDGWKGSAIRLNGGKIHIRAKSFPHGAYTFSGRIRAKTPKADASIASDGDYWQSLTTEGLRIDLLPDRRIKARREIRDSIGEAISGDKIKDGWNHVVVTHDLQSLKIYLNGKLSSEAPVSKPGYHRTHSVPSIGFSQVEKAKHGDSAVGFTGDIDQVEIIGTALDEAAVLKLNKQGQWLAR